MKRIYTRDARPARRTLTIADMRGLGPIDVQACGAGETAGIDARELAGFLDAVACDRTD